MDKCDHAIGAYRDDYDDQIKIILESQYLNKTLCPKLKFMCCPKCGEFIFKDSNENNC